MKNEKGFTLIELIAVITIMGIILTLAVPNAMSMVSKSKKNTFLADAKNLISLVKYQIKIDKNIEEPNAGEAIIVTLGYLETEDIKVSPYGNEYSSSKSFVLVEKKSVDVDGTPYEVYEYYVHLISCNDENCTSIADKDINNMYGTGLNSYNELNGGNRLSLIKQGSTAEPSMIDNPIQYTVNHPNIIETYSK